MWILRSYINQNDVGDACFNSLETSDNRSLDFFFRHLPQPGGSKL